MLLAHHVTRPRLVRALAAADRVLLVAAGGWGKTTLLADWARDTGEPVALVELFDDPTTFPALGDGIAHAVRRAGLSDLARLITATTARGADPRGAAQDVARAFDGAPDVPALIVDDVHRCDEQAAAFLSGLATHHPGRVLLAGRALPAALQDLARRGGALLLGSEDLGLTGVEADALWRALTPDVASAPDPALAGRLSAAVDAWPSAFVLAARRLVDTPQQDVERVLDRVRTGRGALRPLVQDRIAALDAMDARAIAVLAGLPRVDEATATAAGGQRLLERTLAAGVPWLAGADGWLRLADPFREALTPVLDAPVARVAAASYRADDDITAAVDVLLQHGLAEEAAQAASDHLRADPTSVGLELTTRILAGLNDAALARVPSFGLLRARALEQAVQYEERTVFLARLDGALVAHPGSGADAARRAVAAERLFDHTQRIEDEEVDLGRTAELVSRLREELAGCPRSEAVTRARLLESLGKLLAPRETDRHEAVAVLREAAAALIAAGQPTAAVRVLQNLAYHVHVTRGQFALADAALVEATRLVPHTSVVRGRLQCYRTESLVALGDIVGARTALDDAASLFGVAASPGMTAVHAWHSLLVEDVAGNVEGVLTHLATLQDSPLLTSFLGTTIRADVVPVLARHGLLERARTLLGPALEHRSDYFCGVGIAELAVMVRDEDLDAVAVAQRAEVLLRHHALEPRARWRVHAFWAWALRRAGDEAGAGAQRALMDATARVGEVDLAARFEPELSAALREATHGPERGPVLVRVLGAPSVQVGPRRVDLPSAPARSLVFALACAGGSLTVDAVVELLWPGEDEAVGRRRLRNVLARTRAAAGAVVVRSGDRLALSDRVVVDAARLVQESEAAVAARAEGDLVRALSHARDAVGWWSGTLAPEVPGDVAEMRRAETTRAYTVAVDLLASSALAEGDVDEALRWLERGASANPLDERWWLRAHEILAGAGRLVAARAAAERAVAVLAEAGVPVPGTLRAIVSGPPPSRLP